MPRAHLTSALPSPSYHALNRWQPLSNTYVPNTTPRSLGLVLAHRDTEILRDVTSHLAMARAPPSTFRRSFQRVSLSASPSLLTPDTSRTPSIGGERGEREIESAMTIFCLHCCLRPQNIRRNVGSTSRSSTFHHPNLERNHALRCHEAVGHAARYPAYGEQGCRQRGSRLLFLPSRGG